MTTFMLISVSGSSGGSSETGKFPCIHTGTVVYSLWWETEVSGIT